MLIIHLLAPSCRVSDSDQLILVTIAAGGPGLQPGQAQVGYIADSNPDSIKFLYLSSVHLLVMRRKFDSTRQVCIWKNPCFR